MKDRKERCNFCGEERSLNEMDENLVCKFCQEAQRTWSYGGEEIAKEIEVLETKVRRLKMCLRSERTATVLEIVNTIAYECNNEEIASYIRERYLRTKSDLN